MLDQLWFFNKRNIQVKEIMDIIHEIYSPIDEALELLQCSKICVCPLMV